VFYGDATRLDLLRTAGAAHGPHAGGRGRRRGAVAGKIVDLAHAHFPNLEIVARARDVTHWNKLRERQCDAGAA
jgi:glutathione-regulated potassium-efflux system ancillary protein KefC